MTNGVYKILSINDLEKLEFKQQLEYMNNLIRREGNLVKASKKLGAKKAMIKNIFKKKKYDYNEQTQQFEPSDKSSTEGVQVESKPSKKVKTKKGDTRSTVEVQEENKLEIIQNNECTTLALQGADAQEKMLDLINNYDSIKAMLEAFTSNQKGYMSFGGTGRTEGVQEVIEVIKTGIQIDLPESENFKTSIRVNKTEWELFKKFMKENKEFSNGDLISQALKEFRLKHQKS